VSDQPDDRDLDDGGLDLTPRDVDVTAKRNGRRRWAPLAVLGALGVVIVLILIQAGDASMYFKNADEAVAEKETLGSTKFRIQGTVLGKPVSEHDSVVFTIQHGGVSVVVRHTGSEPALFKAGVPVVAEGRWNDSGTEFDSEKLLIKHDENYKEEHPGRVEADESSGT